MERQDKISDKIKTLESMTKSDPSNHIARRELADL